MAESPTYSLAQVIALAKGTTNWYEYAKSVAQHAKNNQDDISGLSGGGTPGWNAAIDSRWYVPDTSTSTTTYTGVTNPTATASDSLYVGYSIRFKANNNNTGASTLNVGTSDGAVNIKKLVGGSKSDLSADDIDSDIFYELIFDGTDWLIVSTPEAADSAYLVPSGGIIIWSGSTGSIPSGWVLCNGANSTPDLRDRFVIGAGSTYSVGDTGGSTTTGAHTLTTAEIPSHTHSIDPPATSTSNNTHNHSSAANSVGGDLVSVGSGNANGADNGNVTGNNTHSHNVNIAAFDSAAAGSGGSHSHTNTIPPYYALAYIMKT